MVRNVYAYIYKNAVFGQAAILYGSFARASAQQINSKTAVVLSTAVLLYFGIYGVKRRTAQPPALRAVVFLMLDYSTTASVLWL